MRDNLFGRLYALECALNDEGRRYDSDIVFQAKAEIKELGEFLALMERRERKLDNQGEEDE